MPAAGAGSGPRAEPAARKKGTTMRATKAIVAVLLLGMAAVVSEAGAEEKKWSDEGELAYVNTSGNTKVTNLAVKNQVKDQFTKRVLGTWKLGALTAETDNVKT